MASSIEVVPYTPDWKHKFAQEAQQIAQALAPLIVALHHIGSTSIPGIYAKPIIDILVEVNDLAQVDRQTPAMTALGYQAMGEYGIPGRCYFRKETATGQRTHHVHIFRRRSPEVLRHLVFRDYLIAHPAEAQAYSDLKRELVQQLSLDDIEGYMDGKDRFIKLMEQRALAWYSFQGEV